MSARAEVRFSWSPGERRLRRGEEAADVFLTPLIAHSYPSTNFQAFDGNGGTAPPLGLPEPFIADLDALGNVGTDPSFGPGVLALFSVDPATAAGPYLGASAADVFASPTVPGYAFSGGAVPPVYASAALLGLVAGDDINALQWWDDGIAGATSHDQVFFSLAPGSPSLAAIGASPADILSIQPGGLAPVIVVPASRLGLLPTDDINALYIPEPSSALFVLLGSIGLFLGRRRW